MQDISKVLETAFHTGCTMSLDLCDSKASAAHYNYVEALKVARDAAYTGNWALANEMFTFADRCQREAMGYIAAYNWNRDNA